MNRRKIFASVCALFACSVLLSTPASAQRIGGRGRSGAPPQGARPTPPEGRGRTGTPPDGIARGRGTPPNGRTGRPPSGEKPAGGRRGRPGGTGQ